MTCDPIPTSHRHDVAGIARDLERLLARLRKGGAQSAETPDREEGLLLAGEHYRRCRVQRPSLFGDGDPADPAWDILIDIFMARSAGRDVSVSSAAIAALVPATTGLRWIDRLCAAGLTEREHDASDGRRVFLRLTSTGEAKVRAWLTRLSSS
jgi:hypothetical protein